MLGWVGAGSGVRSLGVVVGMSHVVGISYLEGVKLAWSFGVGCWVGAGLGVPRCGWNISRARVQVGLEFGCSMCVGMRRVRGSEFGGCS